MSLDLKAIDERADRLDEVLADAHNDDTHCGPICSAGSDVADDARRLIAELTRLRADYRTLWGMTFGHDGQPPVDGAPDDIERLRARFTNLNGEAP